MSPDNIGITLVLSHQGRGYYVDSSLRWNDKEDGFPLEFTPYHDTGRE